MSDDLDNLVHMLGAGDHIPKRKHGYRNYCAAGGDLLAPMERLAAAGLVVFTGERHGLLYYSATEAGCDAIGLGKAAKKRALEGDDHAH